MPEPTFGPRPLNTEGAEPMDYDPKLHSASIQPMEDPYVEGKKVNTIADAVMTVYGYVPLSVRYEAARAAMAVTERYFATTISSAQIDGSCSCDPTQMEHHFYRRDCPVHGGPLHEIDGDR